VLLQDKGQKELLIWQHFRG